MKGLFALVSTASILFMVGCEKLDSRNEPSYAHEQTVQPIVNHVANDRKCETLADSIFGRKLIQSNSDDRDAVLLEFKWSSSSDVQKEQKVSCYFNSSQENM